MSEVSRHAANYALTIARWYDAAVTALHVYNPVVTPTTIGFAVAGPYLPPPLAKNEIEELRAQVLSCFDGACGVAVDVVIDGGRPAPGILELARSRPADLLVIGTHGVNGFEHLVLGSVTEKVLRRAACPVLTVPPHAHSTARLPFKRILCPVDLSDSSLAALDFALSLSREGDAELTILYVFEGWPDESSAAMRLDSIPEYRQAMEREVTDKLRALVPDLTRYWCRPMIRFGYGKPYREVLGIATEERADLIVMGVHGRNALDLMLFGSTTNQVVRRATCPVLTLRT
jgi:nucleotide-binding universal stress UspA family protein